MKLEIWEDNLIEFAVILKPNTTKPKKKAKQPIKALTVNQWSKAFTSYVAVYINNFPQAAQTLLSYSTFILDLAEEGHDWNIYDTLFRKERVEGKFPYDDLAQYLAFKAVAGRKRYTG